MTTILVLLAIASAGLVGWACYLLTYVVDETRHGVRSQSDGPWPLLDTRPESSPSIRRAGLKSSDSARMDGPARPGSGPSILEFRRGR